MKVTFKNIKEKHAGKFLPGGVLLLALYIACLAADNFWKAQSLGQDIASRQQIILMGERKIAQTAVASLLQEEGSLRIAQVEEIPSLQKGLLNALSAIGDLELRSWETIPPVNPKSLLALGDSTVVENYLRITTVGSFEKNKAFWEVIDTISLAHEVESLLLEGVVAEGNRVDIGMTLVLKLFVLMENKNGS
ncbi:MAG: hypothetical protein K9K75_02875 [Deltaproteobacteria bacterium]|nr:hypothetical protein [Deltaproteobacteria bacterium]